MNLEKLLDAIQVQRHDFLNHLQVISGLLQMNKVDRVMDYLNQVCIEIAQYSKTARVAIPELTAALIIAINDAAMYQIELVLNITSDLSESAVPGPVVGEVLELCLRSAFETMSAPEIVDRRIEVVLGESERKYTCRLLFPEPLLADLSRFESALIPAGALLSPYGGRLNLAVANNGIEIFFTLPRQGLNKIG
ncbi:sensory histidine kinase DcuS [Pelotomaculum sp. FP]|uniref:Spo0B domain-containing protein n=1 Tax=Pelotomaculum sp. FP TaxID=261474 RepID=UPI0010667739|nr:Spo0B domain-containing protein [Pelotomaculum sp. FP]TEB16449.1 sensory histidine kinase DcuS [Pelotomaculum sp. FP]